LSYTTFAYSKADLKADGDAIAVTVDVTNTGAVSGATVVQIYAGLSGSKIERPRRHLVGFGRVDLTAGQTHAVVVQVPLRSLAIRDVNSHDWLLESGNWNIEIAQFSGDPQAILQSFVVADQRYQS
jgi:beta-glucosidase